jgi:hypothetical protein
MVSDAPPDIVIDSLAPGKLPSPACSPASRLVAAAPSGAPARCSVLAASASRYGSRLVAPSSRCTFSSAAMPSARPASASAHMMYASVVAAPARPNESSAVAERVKPPLPSRRLISQAAVRSTIAASTS